MHVQTRESGILAAEFMTEIFAVHGIPNVVHADRGRSTTSKPVAALLADLEERTGVSGAVRSIHHARQFMEIFVTWYNHEHRHSGIGLHTPADVHFGLAVQKAAERSIVLADARRAHPERFGSSDRGPKILDLPAESWINKPATVDGGELAADQAAAQHPLDSITLTVPGDAAMVPGRHDIGAHRWS